MDQKTFQVDVVSAEAQIYSGLAVSVFVKGYEGELGIFPGHTQLLTTLPPGALRIQKMNGQEEVLFVAGGVLEVQPNHISVLADTIVRPQDVNEQAALEAKQAAERLLQNKSSGTGDQDRYQLAEALAKLRVLELVRERRRHR